MNFSTHGRGKIDYLPLARRNRTYLLCFLQGVIYSVLTIRRGRDFFKLVRIELQCELSTDEIIVVDPWDDETTESLAFETPESPSPVPVKATQPMKSTGASAIHSHLLDLWRLEDSHNRHEQYRKSDQQDSPLRDTESHRQSSLAPIASVHCPTMMPLSPGIAQEVQPKQLPIQSSVNKPQDIQERTVETSVMSASKHVGIRSQPPPVLSRPQSPHDPNRLNGKTKFQSPRDISLDAIERLQTQISQNSGALAAHTRDIRRGEETFHRLEDTLRHEYQGQLFHQSGEMQRVDEAIARLHHEMQSMHQAMEGFRHEIYVSRVDRQSRDPNVLPAQTIGAQDSALELMAQQIALVSQKANEVDSLKITIEIMKNKIQRLEEGPMQIASQTTSQSHQSLRKQPEPSSHLIRSVAPSFATSQVVPHASSLTQPLARAHSDLILDVAPQTGGPETPQRPEIFSEKAIGWATINTGARRTHANDVEVPHKAASSVLRSPKRQKLVNDSRVSSTASQLYATSSKSTQEIGRPEDGFQALPQTPASPQATNDSTLAPQSQRTSDYPFGTQDCPFDDSWRGISQRTIEHRTRGRPRGGCVSNRGGRGKRNMPAHFQPVYALGLEREKWPGDSNSNSQTTPDRYHSHDTHSGRGIARRGSGGGGGGASAGAGTRGSYASSDRAVSLGLQSAGGSIAFDSPSDSYGFTKKTRTKPIRNADGVLIRKDGRPDMRSQSSAANLRKVHARKEGDPSHSPSRLTPTHPSGQDTPSPIDLGAMPSVHRKHDAIMNRMFPSGLGESRKQQDYTNHLFQEDMDHMVLPHVRSRPSMDVAPLQIKEELLDLIDTAGTRIRHNKGVGMDMVPVETQSSD